MKRNGRLVALLTGAVTITVLGVAAYLEWPHIYFYYLFEPLGQNPYYNLTIGSPADRRVR